MQSAYEVLPSYYYQQPWLPRQTLRLAQRMQFQQLGAALNASFFELNVSAIDPEVRRTATRMMDVIVKWADNYPTSKEDKAEFLEESSDASQAFLAAVRNELGVEVEAA